ncbi:sensor histidine kinase [Plantactinospora mayteni]|uniref:histidine kinase n=1 Tax=Plantactinospora mayteni TaxID=566021 RepID=A0ABQ4F0B5_9ACTN|nr:sensor histidine kinase [Plantactinospora mayteni]GIH00356.1 two-component sensor histidine kinase [Plantactinospora mayteni]
MSSVNRPGHRRLVALDCLGAAGYVGALLLLRHTQGSAPVSAELPGWAADAMTAAIGLPLAVRRPWPLPVLAVVLSGSVLALPLGVLTDPFLATAVALYTVGVAAAGRWWVPAAVLTALGIAGTVPSRPASSAHAYWWQEGPGLIIIGWLLVGGSWLLGSAVRQQRTTAARAAEQLARSAVTTERLRIARELHDIVAHSVGIIAVKAAVANHVVRTRPGEVADALRVIEETSRNALAEMRQMLGVLRSEAYDEDGSTTQRAVDGPTEDGAAPDLAPAPGPEGLPALVERAATSGVRVELAVDGMDQVSEAMGLTIYRIVQESLTNAAKHAAPTRCRVTVEATGVEVRIQVTDDGRDGGAREAGGHTGDGLTDAGHGLTGMRERVLMYGGQFAAGPRPEGGYQVTARIPCQPARRSVQGRP